jgi:phenylacetate-CoA ligase
VGRLLGNLVVLAYLRGQTRAPFLDRQRLDALRDSRIRHIVRYAARHVPFYRELFTREGLDPRDIRGAQDLDALPRLARDQVRREPSRFLSTARRARVTLPLLTGGTTGTPLEVHHDWQSLLANIGFGERERAPVIALSGGAFRPKELHVGYETSNFRKILAFYAAHTRLPVKPRRSSVSMRAPFEEIVAAINTERPDVLTAYGGFLDSFFRTVTARGVAVHAPKVVMYVGETLPAERRAWIERELGARVMSRYCSVEAFKIGYFCERGTGFHLHDDLCHVRVVRKDGASCQPGEAGEIVISNLVNHATVLLNYPTGDVASLAGHACPCGRTHRLMSEVEGRLEDMVPLASGAQVHPRAVWAAFKDDREILQYQLVQHELRRFELKLVTATPHAFPAASHRARTALGSVLGTDALIDVVQELELGRLERAANGKFRAVESRVARPAAVAPEARFAPQTVAGP